MSNLTELQYVSLSELVYSDLSRWKNSSLKNIPSEASRDESIIKRYRDEKNGEISAIFHPLSCLSNWTLLDTVTTSSGMSAIALQNPDTKEVVFAL